MEIQCARRPGVFPVTRMDAASLAPYRDYRRRRQPGAFDRAGRAVVIPCGMTNASTVVSVKIPARILDRIPAAGQGRSRFIVRALEHEIERQRPAEWKPTSKRGRMFAKLLAAGKAERYPLLNEEEFDRELKERRGRNF
jgi:hypothetical protein